ncbi:unnamed protein product [Amoebophrya sp. A25]|nr:unnamed protein product [Amoebophrya sp. A25]|eukprot:GSA25T00012079001.1
MITQRSPSGGSLYGASVLSCHRALRHQGLSHNVLFQRLFSSAPSAERFPSRPWLGFRDRERHWRQKTQHSENADSVEAHLPTLFHGTVTDLRVTKQQGKYGADVGLIKDVAFAEEADIIENNCRNWSPSFTFLHRDCQRTKVQVGDKVLFKGLRVDGVGKSGRPRFSAVSVIGGTGGLKEHQHHRRRVFFQDVVNGARPTRREPRDHPSQKYNAEARAAATERLGTATTLKSASTKATEETKGTPAKEQSMATAASKEDIVAATGKGQGIEAAEVQSTAGSNAEAGVAPSSSAATFRVPDEGQTDSTQALPRKDTESREPQPPSRNDNDKSESRKRVPVTEDVD